MQAADYLSEIKSLLPNAKTGALTFISQIKFLFLPVEQQLSIYPMRKQVAANTVNGSPEKEADRVKAVHQFSDSLAPNEATLQDMVELIAEDFAVPIAAISIIDKEEVWIVNSSSQFEFSSFERHISFSSKLTSCEEIVVIRNAKQDPLFCNHPLVRSKPGIIFFAAAPLLTPEGFCIGAVCIADTTERILTDGEKSRLQRFARCVMNDLQMKATLQRKIEGLEEQEYQLKQAGKLARIGRWEFDFDTNRAVWSDELYEIYGVEKNSCGTDLFLVYLSLVHPDDLGLVQKKLANMYTGPDLTSERLIRPDGQTIYINQFWKNFYDASGRLVKCVGISQDVTEQVMIEEKLRRNESKFSTLVQKSSDMIAIVDEVGTICFVTASSLAICGYESEELIGHNFFEYMHEADIPEIEAEFAHVADNTNSGEPTLHRFKAKDGTWVWLESTGSNMLDDQQVAGIVINARNVTERVQLEEQLAIEQQNNQRAITSAVIRAQEAERSEVGRELHDNVNQVLTTVKLYTEMVHDGLSGEKELLKKSGQLLQSCIDEIRSISKRLSAPTLGDISLAESIKELLESINLTNRIEIVYKGEDLAYLYIPQEVHLAVYRIIQEQLNNIIKYAEASLVTIALRKTRSMLTLQITDNGKGFDTAAKRTGIGITNMQTRAENLGGKFRVQSSQGNGCEVTVRFPLCAAGETSPHQS